MFNDVTKTDFFFFFFLTCRRKDSAGNRSGRKLMTIAWDKTKDLQRFNSAVGWGFILGFFGPWSEVLSTVLPKSLGDRAERGRKMMALGSSAGDQISRVEIHQQEGTSRERETRNQVCAPRDEGRGQDVMSLNGIRTQELFANIWGLLWGETLLGFCAFDFHWPTDSNEWPLLYYEDVWHIKGEICISVRVVDCSISGAWG